MKEQQYKLWKISTPTLKQIVDSRVNETVLLIKVIEFLEENEKGNKFTHIKAGSEHEYTALVKHIHQNNQHPPLGNILIDATLSTGQAVQIHIMCIYSKGKIVELLQKKHCMLKFLD